jgi:hypothetical protein
MNPYRYEYRWNHVKKISSYSTENTLCLRYKDQLVNAI